MPLHLETVISETGLTYRVRRGEPHRGLILLLHGLSGDENVMWIFERVLPRQATVVAPRALYPSEFGGYSWTRSAVRGELDAVDFREALALLPRFTAELFARFAIDPQPVIALGFSQGAALSYAYSLAQPAALRGVAALAGFLSVSFDTLAAAANLPRYLIIHGTHDEAVPIARAREARTQLQARGANVDYHEHHVGHKVSAQGMKEIERWITEVMPQA